MDDYILYQISCKIFLVTLKADKVESPVSGHPWETEKVSVCRAVRLRESLNTVFVWKTNRTIFLKTVRLRECPQMGIRLYINTEISIVSKNYHSLQN